MLERLQKIISAAGVSSRRAAEELIAGGRVRVNGQVVTELGSKADASKDHIKVDGKLINPKQPMTYIILNKPAGYVTTMSDPEGRPTVQDLMKGVKVRVYPVGRLDYNTEGLLIMTNDGDFAHLVTHPKHELPKTYLAKIKGVLDEKAIESLETGVFLDDGKTAPAKIKKVRKEEANSWVEITIHEGRKRQVRRMFDRVGRSVIKLKRTKTGNLLLGDLPEGAFRHLTHEEVQGLRALAQETEISGQKPEVRRETREEGRLWSEGSRREATEKRRELRNEGRGTLGRRWEAGDRGTGFRSQGDRNQRPMAEKREPRETRRETSARGPKTAHKGRKPDMRPRKVAERAEEYRRDSGSKVQEPGYRVQGNKRQRPRDESRRWSEGNRREAGSRVQGPGSRGQGLERRAPRGEGRSREGENRQGPREMKREARNEGRRPGFGSRPRSGRPTGAGPRRGTKFGGRGVGRKQ